MIFPEALASAEEMRAFNARCAAPTLANMTEFGRTPYLDRDAFAALGFDIVIWPVTSLRREAEAMRGLYAHLAARGGQGGYLDKLMSRKEIYRLIGYRDYEALDRSIVESVVPEDGRS